MIIREWRLLFGGQQERLRGPAASLLAVPLLGGYCLLVAIFAEPLMRLVYGEKYAGNASLVALYATCTCFWYVSMIITAALWARRLTRLVFMNRLCVGLIATPVGYFLILTLGIHGVVLSMIATSLALYLLSWRVYWRDLAGREFPQVVGQREQLQPHLVVLETAARTTGSTSPHSCTTLRHALDDVRAYIEQSLTRSSDGRFERVLGPPSEGPNGGPTMTRALVSSELIRSV